MRNTRALWTCFAAALMFGGVVSAQDNRREQADHNRPAKREAKRGDASVEGVQLISKGQAGWRYLDTREAPPKAWIQADFNDSKWKEGSAPLGYGESDVATLLTFGDDSELKFPAAFFRLKFEVRETSEIYAGKIRADDGAVIYLNGREIHRLRMPEDEIDYAAYLGDTVRSSSKSEGEFVLLRIDSEHVVKGENVLCVSIHQSSGTSSDLILDMELFGLSKKSLARLEKLEKANREFREQDPDGAARNRERGGEQRARAGQARLAAFLREKLDSLLPHICEGVGQRYDLDETAVEGLRLSIREVMENKLEEGDVGAFATPARTGNFELLEALLSEPDSKAAFAKHLSKTQLQDYLDFNKARRQRDQRAVDRHLVAGLDRELSLTVAQREKIEQLPVVNVATNTVAKRGWRMTSTNMLAVDPREAAYLISERFKGGLDGVLSQTQTTIWQGLVGPRKGNDKDFDDEEREIAFEKAEAQMKKLVAAGRITREQAEERLAGLKRQLWGDDEDASNNRAPEKRAKLIAEAKLKAHTEQLGPLDARASRRLALVSKGVVEEYLEAQAEDPETVYKKAEAKLIEAFRAGKIARADIRPKLEALKKEIWGDEKDPTRPKAPGSGADITNHALYQQTIKNVLSEDAFAAYQARQAERQIFRQQASRDLVVASLDTFLLLGEKQRKHFEVAAAKLSSPPASDKGSAPARMLAQLFERTDDEFLSPLQRKFAAELRERTGVGNARGNRRRR